MMMFIGNILRTFTIWQPSSLGSKTPILRSLNFFVDFNVDLVKKNKLIFVDPGLVGAKKALSGLRAKLCEKEEFCEKKSFVKRRYIL